MGEAFSDGAADASRRALRLSLFTVAYNVIEGAVSVLVAASSGSTALLGFGVDSFVESLSGAVMVWRFWRPIGAHEREQRAAQLVGISFLVLAVYVAYEAVSTWLTNEAPDRSLVAIAIAVISLAVMPTLFLLKRRTARVIGSGSLLADSRQTLACCLLSVAVLLGTGLNYLCGWWQADPVAALFIAAYLIWEGYEAFTTRELCAC